MKLIILDRDGVINRDSDDYIRTVTDWIPLPGSLAAIARLQELGYTVAIATNQSGIARGYFDRDTLAAMHDKMNTLLADYGRQIDCIEYCPHGPDEGCACRKPKPGMFNTIVRHFAVDPATVITVGDSLRDYQAAQAAGMQFVLVRTGKGQRTLDSAELPAEVPVYDDLYDFADHLAGAS